MVHPFPDESEKNRLAAKTGLTLHQVFIRMRHANGAAPCANPGDFPYDSQVSYWFINSQQVWQPIFEEAALGRPEPSEPGTATRADSLRARVNSAVEHQQAEISMPGDDEGGGSRWRDAKRGDADYHPADHSAGSSE
jgi:hypothetical protein